MYTWTLCRPSLCLLGMGRLLLLLLGCSLVSVAQVRAQSEPITLGFWGIWCNQANAPQTSADWNKEVDQFNDLHTNFLVACIPPDKEYDTREYTQAYGIKTAVEWNPDSTTWETGDEGKLSRWVRGYWDYLSSGHSNAEWESTADEILLNMRTAYGGQSGMGPYLVAHEACDRLGTCSYSPNRSDTSNWMGLRYILNEIRDTDPNHPSLVVDFWYPGRHYPNNLTLADFAQLFPSLDIYAVDHYAFHKYHSVSYSDQQSALGALLLVYDEMMQAFMNTSTEWHAIIQTHHEHNPASSALRRPTLEEVRAQAYLALSRGAKGIIGYVYDTTVGDTSVSEYGLVDGNRDPYTSSTDPAGQNAFGNVQDVYGDILPIATVLKGLNVTDAFPNTAIPSGNEAGIISVSGDKIEIGVFEDASSVPYFMVVNRVLNTSTGALASSQTVQIQLAGNPVVEEQGSFQTLSGTYNQAANRTTFNVTLDPGAGKLFKVCGLDLHDATITGTETYESCSITAGTNFTIASGANVTFSASNSIRLLPGFSAEAGATFYASIDPNAGFLAGPSLMQASSATLPSLSMHHSGPAKQKAEVQAEHPGDFALDPNYPNPFNPSTVIRYSLQEDSEASLRVYNILGQEVRTLVDGARKAGRHQAEWDGRNSAGVPVPSGVYFYRLTAGGRTLIRTMVLQK